MMKKYTKTKRWGIVFVCCVLSSIGAIAGQTDILYEEDFDDLSSLGPQAGFQSLPELERAPTALAIDEYSRNTYYSQDFIPVSGSITIRFLISSTVASNPDSPGGRVYLQGISGETAIVASDIRWSNVIEGLPAYQDLDGWVQIGDTNFDGIENDGEEWPPALPVSDPDQPDQAQWIPIQLVINIDEAIFDYWQGAPNDMSFSTLKLYGEDLYTVDFPPEINRFYFNPSSSGDFIDNLEISHDGAVVFENDFEGIPERDDSLIAIGEHSLMLLKDIDGAYAYFDPILENFTFRFLISFTTLGGYKNQRAAQVWTLNGGNTGSNIVTFICWGETEPGSSNFYDGTAWRQIGDTNQNLVEDGDETWPPLIEITDPEDPTSAKWYPVQLDLDIANHSFDFFMGPANDLNFENLTQYGDDLWFWRLLDSIDGIQFQNKERGMGDFFVDNVSIVTKSGQTVIEQDFEGAWGAEASERVAGGGELEEIIAVGDKSLKVRSGVDNLSIDFGSQTEPVTIDFLMASTVTGAAGARACQVIIRQDSTLGGHVVWGQLEPGVANYYDGAQWNFIGDTNKDGVEDAGELRTTPILASDPDSGVEHWYPIRIIADPKTNTYEFWQGDEGDLTFSTLVQYETDAMFWQTNQLSSIDNLFLVNVTNSGGDYFIDNVKIYTEETPVREWSLY